MLIASRPLRRRRPSCRQIENDRGLAGDLYQLPIPAEVAGRAARVGWRAGKLHALRPVFRELGHPAAFVYEALEHTQGRPTRSFDLTNATGLSRRALYEALQTLAAWHLAESRGGRWLLVTGTSLHLRRGPDHGVRALQSQPPAAVDEPSPTRPPAVTSFGRM